MVSLAQSSPEDFGSARRAVTRKTLCELYPDLNIGKHREGAGREGIGRTTEGRVCAVGHTHPAVALVALMHHRLSAPRYRWSHHRAVRSLECFSHVEAPFYLVRARSAIAVSPRGLMQRERRLAAPRQESAKRRPKNFRVVSVIDQSI